MNNVDPLSLQVQDRISRYLEGNDKKFFFCALDSKKKNFLVLLKEDPKTQLVFYQPLDLSGLKKLFRDEDKELFDLKIESAILHIEEMIKRELIK